MWYDPGAFRNGFKGVCTVFVTAAFAFSGTELVGLASAEAENPIKALPGAIKQVFWRITLSVSALKFDIILLTCSDFTLSVFSLSASLLAPPTSVCWVEGSMSMHLPSL